MSNEDRRKDLLDHFLRSIAAKLQQVSDRELEEFKAKAKPHPWPPQNATSDPAQHSEKNLPHDS